MKVNVTKKNHHYRDKGVIKTLELGEQAVSKELGEQLIKLGKAVEVKAKAK